MSESVNVYAEEYGVMVGESGEVIIEGDYVFLQNYETKEIMKAPLDVVGPIYGISVPDKENREPVLGECSTSTQEATNTAANKIFCWTEEQTKYMLHLYSSFLNIIGPLKKFKNKKRMWEEIAHKLNVKYGVTVSAEQVENRYKNVLRRQKRVISENTTSGNARHSTPFDTEMANIIGVDDSIVPEVTIAPGIVNRKEVTEMNDEESPQKEQSPCESSNTTPIKRTPLQEKIINKYIQNKEDLLNKKLSVLEKIEKSKQERHKERLEIQKIKIEAIKEKTAAIKEKTKALQELKAEMQKSRRSN